MTCNVFGGTLNLAQSINLTLIINDFGGRCRQGAMQAVQVLIRLELFRYLYVLARPSTQPALACSC